MKWLIPWTVTGIAEVERAEVQGIDGVVGKVAKVAFEELLLKGWEQQQLLPRIIGKIGGSHACPTFAFPAAMMTSLLKSTNTLQALWRVSSWHNTFIR